MELSPSGRILIWLNIALFATGTILLNPILIIAFLIFLYTLYEGISFQHAVNTNIDALKLENSPSEIETNIGNTSMLESTITNHSKTKYDVLKLKHLLPNGVTEHLLTKPGPYTLNEHGELRLRTELKAEQAGNFAIPELTLTLESRRGIFTHQISLHDRLQLIAKPPRRREMDPIDTDSLDDLTRDMARRGIGTDLAGLRPMTYLDDYRTIDWRATARIGKPVAREFYQEKDPTILLMIDVAISGHHAIADIIEGLNTLTSNIRMASPVGIVLYDRRAIISSFQAEPGVSHRERILRLVLATLDPSKQTHRGSNRPYINYTDEVHDLVNEIRSVPDSKRYKTQLTRIILPYYAYASLKRLRRLREQGNYLAFESASRISDPALLVVITDGSTNMEGLVEGAKLAVMSNHKVAIMLLSQTGDEPYHELTPLIPYGISISRPLPSNLAEGLHSEILELGHKRTIRTLN